MNQNVKKAMCLAAALVLTLAAVRITVPAQAEEIDSFTAEQGRNGDGYAGSAYIPMEGEECVLYNEDGDEMEPVTAFGIDVSHHQGTIDWDTVATQIDFAILRCGYGDDLTKYDDRQWYANADACTRLGIPFGVYIYSYAFTDEEALSEAEHVLRLIEGYDPALPIYLDLEDNSILANCSTEDILRHATIFCDRIEQAGYDVGIYANYYWWTNFLTAPEYDQWDRWLARYASEAGLTKDYSMWQYTSAGSIDGISGNVDLNYWYGDFPGKEHQHDLGYAVTLEPTASTGGTLTGTCFFCGSTDVVELPKLNAVDYTYLVTETVSCTHSGSAVYTWNTTCFGEYSFQVTLEKTDHCYGAWMVSKAPTTRENGEEIRNCIHCGEVEKRSIDRLPNPFTDVSEADYYYDPALWAYDNAITKGDGGEDTFNPNGLCTRDQVVTFLWRGAGSPEPVQSENPFVDVQEEDYFYKAVLWAVEQGITVGVDVDRFGPEQSCTRAQVVTFLWRYAGKPEHGAVVNPFEDVAKTAYYYTAVAWAVDNEITQGDGSGTTFHPDGECTRGQIVTFLYRYMG